MDPKILQAMGAIAQALASSHPQESQQLQQWVRAGGNYALPASVLALSLPLAPTVGMPATAILAALRGVQGQPGADPMQKISPAGEGSGLPSPGTSATGASLAVDPDNPRYQPGGDLPMRQPVASTGGVQGGNPLLGTVPLRPDQQFANSPGAPAFASDPRNSGMPPMALQTTTTTPTIASPGGGSPGNGNPGGIGNTENLALGEDDDYLLRFALKSAGFNPDVATPAEKIAAKYLAPMVQARRAAFGLNDPAGGNIGGLGQDIASFAKEFSTPGANFFGNAANYAKQILGGAGFANIGGLKDPEQVMGAYASLLPLLYGGANPLVAQSAQDQTRKLFNMYKDTDIRGADTGGAGIFQDWLAKQKDLTPLIRSIFNMR